MSDLFDALKINEIEEYIDKYLSLRGVYGEDKKEVKSMAWLRIMRYPSRFIEFEGERLEKYVRGMVRRCIPELNPLNNGNRFIDPMNPKIKGLRKLENKARLMSCVTRMTTNDMEVYKDEF